jgi:SWI/SNF-related matrix-associated actin-dependent regulator 1 of chromatin subfamily A
MVALFDYQKAGAEWLTKGRVRLLADEMGLGKSAQAIAAADTIGATRILVLCPAVARINWTREWAKFSQRSLTCGAILKAKDSTKPLPAVTICSYDLATTAAVCSKLSAVAWHVIVLDEAHFLKNPKAKRTKAVLGKICQSTERLWALTGTPAPNYPNELYPLLRVFGVWRDNYWAFVERFCTVRDTDFGKQITGGRNIDELRALLAPVMLRRKKDEVMKDLPPLLFTDVAVEATPLTDDALMMYFSNYLSWPADKRVKVFYDTMAKDQKKLDTLCNDIGMTNGSMKILEGLDKQITTLRRYIGLQKCPEVIKTIRAEIEAGAYEKIVIFAVHKDVMETLREGLKDLGAVMLWGGTPPVKRDRLIQKFQTDARCKVFIGQIVAAGTAITLTAAHQVAVVEADWTPANNQQAVMRCHRIGQTAKCVNVRFFGLAGSIDERIQQVLKQKTRTLVQLFDNTPAPIDVFAD